MGVIDPRAVLPTAAENVSAFVDNVVRFPLGLAGVRSPAASPLVGHLVVSLFPGIHRDLHPDVGGRRPAWPCSAYVLGSSGGRRLTGQALARLVGWVMAVAILLAPATRVGYLLYPIDFFVWAWLLRSEDTVDPPGSDGAVHGYGAGAGPGGRRVAWSSDDPGGARSGPTGSGGSPEGPTTGDGPAPVTAGRAGPQSRPDRSPGATRVSPGRTPRTAAA